MALRITAWFTLLAFTAIVPGCVIGIVASARKWPVAKCRSLARRMGWGILIACGLVAWIAGMKYPLGWAAEPLGSIPAIVSEFLWIGLADTAPRLIAQRIAYPRLRD